MRALVAFQNLLGRIGLSLGWCANWRGILAECDLVIDVGANVGQTVKFMRSRGARGKIICYEPNPEAARRLAQLGDDHVEVRQCALSDQPGEQDFFIRKEDEKSSLLLEKDGERGQALKVKVCRLDEFALDAYHNVFLKIDAEGHDLAVIRGATGVLSRVNWVMMEVIHTPRYHGEPDSVTVFTTLRELGFIPAFVERNMWSLDRQTSLGMDVVFTKLKRS